jgi:carbon-monoxide dehydrogenase catalytic subunit
MSEKAVCIGFYVVASGVFTVFGTPFPVMGSENVRKYLCEDMAKDYGATFAFELPAAPFDAYSVAAYVAGVRVGVTLSGALLTTMTFGVAPASGTDNIVVDIVAVAA